MKTIKIEDNLYKVVDDNGKNYYKGTLLDCYAFINVCERFIK